MCNQVVFSMQTLGYMIPGNINQSQDMDNTIYEQV